MGCGLRLLCSRLLGRKTRCCQEYWVSSSFSLYLPLRSLVLSPSVSLSLGLAAQSRILINSARQRIDRTKTRVDTGKTRSVSLALAAVCALLVPDLVVAQAPESELLDGNFYFRIGGQAFTRLRTTIRVDSETLGQGTELTLEDDANLEERITVGRLDAGYRFTHRHSMAFSYYDIKRNGSRIIDKEIKWDEEIFPINTTVESLFRERIFKLSYAYTFLIRPKGVMAASAGLHIIKFETGLRAFDGSLESSNSADAPLPVIGIRGQYRFADRWRFVGSAEWFDVKTGNFTGTFSDTVLSVEHDTWDRFGFGFGINTYGLDVSSGDEHLKGTIHLKFDSFLLYFKGYLRY